MNVSRFFAPAALAAFALACACTKPAATASSAPGATGATAPDKVVATFNGGQITAGELEKEVRRLSDELSRIKDHGKPQH